MQEQLKVFRENLASFARKHKKEITKNPEFRLQFCQMCATIGVDPLASNKGFWGELLGVGDFYYELGVQILHICLESRANNGGLFEMNDLLSALNKYRGDSGFKISMNDIESSVQKLQILGNGFNILKVGNKSFVQTVPYELNLDHKLVIELAERYQGRLTIAMINGDLGWQSSRILTVMDLLMQKGIVWIDRQEKEEEYWFPSLIPGCF
eukprot:TRINITY_DN8594_c0_g1_i1.p1 TRINITY_DN8594_c0_g1~~TRINITY_DN8594_c0_g1_i1.p1  ORF type:complete len:210 (-),score=45.91 TRINITY_DN8594_c0_g1_i1:21-650(-)